MISRGNAWVRTRERSLAQFRRRTARLLSALLWVNVPIVLTFGHSAAAHQPLAVATIFASLAATAAAWLAGDALVTRLIVAAALAATPALLASAGVEPALMSRDAYPFAMFALLGSFLDWRPIALAAILTTGAELALAAGDVTAAVRVATDAVLTSLECVSLFWLVARVTNLIASTERALSETEAANARLRLIESVVVNANDAVLIADASAGASAHDSPITFVNGAFTRITGYSAAEVLGRTPRLLCGAATDLATLVRIEEALRDGQPIREELVAYRKDGSEHHVETSTVPLFGDEGAITHFISLQRDVSERRAAQLAIIRAAAAERGRNALVREIEERKQLEAQLSHAAFHDELTGLANRALFAERLAQTMERARTDESYANAVLFLDCDRFKLVNDSYGHLTGDLLLQALARRLEGCLREGDTVARLGGDEFTILLENVGDRTGAEEIAERVLAEVAAPFALGEHLIYATVSIGLVLDSGAYTTPDELLRDADVAMYQAKALGKSRFAVFSPALLERSQRLLRIETELRRALEKGELAVHYQPVVSLERNELRGFEALVRWDHPELGSIPPTEFIPVAEDTGIITALGTWVLEEAIRQTQLWNVRFDEREPLTIAVNVSAKQLDDPRFVAIVQEALASSGLPPGLLHVEITETVVMADPEHAAIVLGELRRLGVKVHVDDFGMGYSSLAYLRQFPIDTLKIDRSFVSSQGDNLADPEIVETIIALARQLSLEVTAEGIETDAQAVQLQALRCDNAQGFRFAKPLCPEDVETYLLAGSSLSLALLGADIAAHQRALSARS